MKALKYITATAALALFLSGCGKTSNGSTTTTAVTPTSACVFNGSAYYYSGTTTPCNPAATTSLMCPANGVYTQTCAAGQLVTIGTSTVTCPMNGVYTVSCIPNQYINGGGMVPPTGYPYSSYPQNGCAQWTQMYGVQYVPVNTQQYGLVCVRYDYLNAYSYNTPYYNNYNYYYAYPPYTGNSCSTSIYLGSSYGSLGVCF